MPRVVLDMMDRRSIWELPDWVPSEIRDALAEGWELVVIDEETDGSGDGAARLAPAVLEAVREAEIYVGFGIHQELLEAGADLEWVHTGAAGVGKSLTARMLDSPVVFTNSAGVHGPPIAETVLAMILFFGRGLDFAVEGQRRAEWWADPYYAKGAPIRELADSTIGIVGFGGIGQEVARRVASLGANVIALKRKAPVAGDEDLEPVGGGESLGSHIELLCGAAGLDALLQNSDVVVVTAPETAETRGLISAEALARMKPGALFVNVSRGKLVDQEALVSALAEGRLRGAGLDVFAEEPLASGHPLWDLPNVVLTPHVSAVTRGFWRRETDLIVRNLGRYFGGLPVEEWENVVDKQAGY